MGKTLMGKIWIESLEFILKEDGELDIGYAIFQSEYVC